MSAKSASPVDGELKPTSGWSWVWLSRWPGLLLMAVVALLAYDPALRGSFVWDDQDWTTQLPAVKQGWSGLVDIWLHPSLLQQYYPLTATSFWLDYQLWEFNTLPYHVENVLLHALSAWLFLRLLRLLEVPGAVLAAGIFLLHPVMVESVAWITERKNVLSLALFLAAALRYGSYAGLWPVERAAKPAWRPLFSAFILFGAALAAKVTVLVFAPVMLILCWWKRGRLSIKRDVLPLVPFIVLAVVVAERVGWQEHHEVGARGAEFALALDQRVAVAGRAFWFYPGKLLWPFDLSFVYPRWKLSSGEIAYFLAPCLTVLALIAAWWSQKRLGRGPAAAVALYAVAVFPVLGFSDIFSMRYSFVWDHWAYLPSLGLIALFAAAALRLCSRLPLRAFHPVLAVALLVGLGVLTSAQSRQFQRADALWRTTIERNPECWMAHYNLALDLDHQGWIDEAIPYYEKALLLEPKRPEPYNNLGSAMIQKGDLEHAAILYSEAVRLNPDDPEVAWNLATVLLQQKKDEEALKNYRRAVDLRPDSVEYRKALGKLLIEQNRGEEAAAVLAPAAKLQPSDVELRYNLGTALMRSDKLKEAQSEFEKVLSLHPDDVNAIVNLGTALLRAQQPKQAEERFREAMKLQPDDATLITSLGWVMQKTGRVKEAIAEYKRALALKPKLAAAHRNLAWIYATCPDATLRNGDTALSHAEQAEAEDKGSDAHTLMALAAAQAERHDFATAWQTAGRARDLVKKQNNPRLLTIIEAQMRSYEESTPLRDPSLAGTR